MSAPAGVMDSSYASDRLRQPHLRFRFQTRALVAVQAMKQYGPAADAPRVVDFGAAEGLTLLEMRRLLGGQGEYIGIEFAEDLIRSAPPLPAGVQLLQGDVTRLPELITPDSCDLVSALATLDTLRSRWLRCVKPVAC